MLIKLGQVIDRLCCNLKLYNTKYFDNKVHLSPSLWLVTVIWFEAQANFYYCHSCRIEWLCFQKWSKWFKNNHLASLVYIHDSLWILFRYYTYFVPSALTISYQTLKFLHPSEHVVQFCSKVWFNMCIINFSCVFRPML